MPSKSNPEMLIIEKMIDQLKTVTPQVHLGYSATGLEQDLELPAILVQLESISEEARQGLKAKCRMQFNVSCVTKTNKTTTFKLIELSNAIRNTFNTTERFTPEAKKTTFSETQFDIAPSNSHWSFADMTLQIDVIF